MLCTRVQREGTTFFQPWGLFRSTHSTLLSTEIQHISCTLKMSGYAKQHKSNECNVSHMCNIFTAVYKSQRYYRAEYRINFQSSNECWQFLHNDWLSGPQENKRIGSKCKIIDLKAEFFKKLAVDKGQPIIDLKNSKNLPFYRKVT